MKAIVVHEIGGPEQLIVDEVPEPTPGDGELRIKVSAAGLNFIDTYQRGGLYTMSPPFTPGREGAGEVVETGPGVTGFVPGDQVAWEDALGSYAEQIVIPEEKALPIPQGVSDKQAAAVILQGITAQYLVTSTHPLQAGERCLIHAGAGGVGLLLTQMAKEIGAEVITTVGSEAKEELSRASGSDLVINYSIQDFKAVIEEQCGPRPLHVVYDGVGEATFDDGLDLLRPRGLMVTFGNASGPAPAVVPLDLMRKGSLFLTRPTMGDYTATREELESRAGYVFDRVTDGRLDVRIGSEYSLEEAAEAHRALESRQTTGKVLLIP